MHRFAILSAPPSLLLFLFLAWPALSVQPKSLRIGIANTFFNERSKGVVDIAKDDFKEVMKKTTGLDGEMIPAFDATQIADKLDKKQLDFGIFHAHEFAWVQKKNPDLKPLLIAANKYRVERAFVIVHKNSAAKTLADLRGKKLDVPAATKEHCKLFLERYCSDKEKTTMTAFFGAVVKSPIPATALDEVARGKVDAAVIDTIALDLYKNEKGPVFEKNLKVLVQSEAFPPALIAYKPGALDKAILSQFEKGLLKAHTSDQGRDMMKEWNIDAFEAIPKDYSKSLADVLKAYPPPAAPR